MAKDKRHLTVFLASPGDTESEREIVSKVVNEINLYITDNIHLDLVRWETHALPGKGVDGQDVINQTVGVQHDIFIGILWGRLGTSTHRAPSGTVEEYRAALEQCLLDPSNHKLMFYFKTEPVDFYSIDLSQLQAVKDFQHEIQEKDGNLTWSFSSKEDFERELRRHLTSLVKGYGSEWGIENVNANQSPSDEAENLIVEDSDEPGLFELISRAHEYIHTAIGAVPEMPDLSESKENFLRIISSLRLGKVSPYGKADAASDTRTANSGAIYINRMTSDLTPFSVFLTGIRDALQDCRSILKMVLGDIPAEERTDLRDYLQLKSMAQSFIESTNSYTDDFAHTARLSQLLGNAVNRLINTIKRMRQLCREIEGHCDYVIIRVGKSGF